ncbi:MAG: M20/M25/M40 family metallo-hydrolase [Atribacterota bacterium]|nr:M20/M25/M40 family metallo-hydrolase [Atribacterota bacterium]
MKKELNKYISKNKNKLIKIAEKICKIPSPTGQEGKKAVFIKKMLDTINPGIARIDEAGNVLYRYTVSPEKKYSVYAAHIDTVFKDIKVIEPKIIADKMYAPSIGDNTINVAALIFIIKMIKKGIFFPDKNIIFVFNVGEEGLGNLKGIKLIIENFQQQIEEVIAVDGEYSFVYNAGVGSKRYLVKIKTPGGHSYSDFGNESAIRVAAKIIAGIYNIIVPEKVKTTYNVGIINGGTSINTIAQECEFNVDLRSEESDSLLEIENNFLNILNNYQNDNTVINFELIGERPCGFISIKDDLVQRIIETRKELGLEIKFESGSTDANLPLSKSIPAISFGVYLGKGAHTTKEYIDINSLEVGIKHLLYFMLK